MRQIALECHSEYRCQWPQTKDDFQSIACESQGTFGPNGDDELRDSDFSTGHRQYCQYLAGIVELERSIMDANNGKSQRRTLL